MHRPEVLAPAGNADALRAAVRAGADAVYLGLQGFNARARADNFDLAGLRATMRELHDHGVRGYVTLNTLVFDDELPAFERAVRAAAEADVDAVIVQDLGAVRLVRAIAPDLPIHASTQMTCTDAASVELARSLGASRIILARELSLDDIAALRRETDAELEVFVHGALCIAYSGQCLTSEAIGGRSANRGACAQACRLPYELVVDGVLQDLGDRAYLLSPQDLEASALVPALMELGVHALKIEGRLKGPEYVGAVTRLYRTAVDAVVGQAGQAGQVGAPGPSERREALQMFSRGSGPGFLAGVDHQRLVEGRACDHRGVLVGTCTGVRVSRGKDHLVVRASEALALGDGILVEGGFAGEGELGGRVWGLVVDGESVRRANAGREALVWLGPDRPVRAARSVYEPAPRVWKTNDPAAEREVNERLERAPHKVALDLSITGAIGGPLVVAARTERGAEATVSTDANLERARSAPLDVATLRDKLGRLGDTPFTLRGLDVDLPRDVIVPVSTLNRARRALCAALSEAWRWGAAPPEPPGSDSATSLRSEASARAYATTTTSAAGLLGAVAPPDRAPPPGGLFVLCRTLPQAVAALDAGADGITLDFLELTGTGVALRALRARGAVHITLAPPRIRKPGEAKIDRYLESLAPDALLVRSLGALREATPIPRVGDFSLNVTNRLTAALVLDAGAIAFTPAFDLDASQLLALLDGPIGAFAEVVVHHPMPLFHMEHCVIAALVSEGKDHRTCGRPCDRHQVSLRDRAGMDHPVEADVGCRNTVFHAAAQSAAGLLDALRARGVRRFRVELVREDPDDVARVVGTYRALLDGQMVASDAWRRLRTESGYGVVRGSLRVLPS